MLFILKADICHAYQILHKNGIPDERIIVFMYDDIAHNSEWVKMCLSMAFLCLNFALN